MGESIQCWQCGTRMTLDELASNDGDCPRCDVEVHLAEYLDNALSKVATLEAERAEQWSLRREAEAKVDTKAAIIAELQDENAKLRAELERRAPDGLPLVIAGALFDFAGFLTTREHVIDIGATCNASPVVDLLNEFAGLRGLSLEDAAVLSWQELLIAAAPSAPKADDPVKQMLLEALNGMLLHIREPESESEFQWPEHFKKQKAAFAAARAAIAAARKGE